MGAAVLLAIFLLDKVPLIAGYAAPPGADPGNWLSQAWGLFGLNVRLADWAYPPFTLMILRALLAIFQPLMALKILGMAAWFFCGFAFWLAMVRFFPGQPFLIRLGITVLFVFAGYNGEIFSFGGYPQLMGMAFLVIAIPHLEAWLVTGRRNFGKIALAATTGVIFTHHLLAATLPVLWALLIAWVLIWAGAERRLRTQRAIKIVGFQALLSLPAVPIYWKYVHLLAGNPTNTSGFSLQTLPTMLQYLYRDSVALWVALIVLAMLVPFVLRKMPMAGSTFVFSWGALIVFLPIWEVRLLQLTFVGAGFGLALFFEWIRLTPVNRIEWDELKRVIMMAGLGIILLIAIPDGQREFQAATSYYRILDNPLIPGVTWIRDNTPPGDRVAVSQTKPFFIGWWVEGLGQRPAFYAADPRWLSFKQEKRNTAIANQIFDPLTAPDRIAGLLHANQIHWLFVERNSGPNNLDRLVAVGLLRVAYEDDRVVIYQVGGKISGRIAYLPPDLKHVEN